MTKRIVLFSGGTACRNINVALCRLPVELTRIVPAWDSGGSSRTIREAFGVIAVGDIRQALMTMAHGEGRAGDVVKIFNARISAGASPPEARAEFAYYAESRHPLLRRLEPGLRGVILSYLAAFQARAGDAFDFRGGSIGNFILTGAYFSHGDDINNAIFVFRQLCTIHGQVWPSTKANGVALQATLGDGSRVAGQHRVTALDEGQAAKGIARIALTAPAGEPVDANGAALDAVRSADLVVFGPGSLFSSLMPHLLVDGIAEAVAANRGVPKAFVGNILECAETRGMSVAEMLERFLALADAKAGAGGLGLTHVVHNAELFPFDRWVGQARYARRGDLEALCDRHGMTLVEGHFEDAWNRGQHDGPQVAEALAGLAQGGG